MQVLDPFIVRYRGRFWQLAIRTIGSGLAIAALFAALGHFAPLPVPADATGSDHRVAWGLGALVTLAILADLFLVVFAFGTGRPALRIKADAIEGFHGGLWRRIPWHDVDEIAFERRYLSVYRRPATSLGRLWKKGARSGGRYDYRARIVVPLRHVDRTEREIRTALAIHNSGDATP